MYNNTFIQSTGGNILITSNGTGGGMYFNTTGGIYASSNTATPTAIPTAGGTLTINATGTSYHGIEGRAGSLVSFGAMNITARGAGAVEGFLLAGSGVFRSVGNIIIDSATSGANWGFALYDGRVIQSTVGNISVTAVGNFGLYVNGTFAASASTTDISVATAPGTGGTITINATGRTQQGLEMVAGSLIANNGLTITGSATGAFHGVYIAGAGSLKAVGDIALTATTTGVQWAFYQTSSRFIQSTTGNITLTATAIAGHGIFINGGGLVAGNNTTDPTAGGSITINSQSRANDGGGAALKLQTDGTKIIAFGDIDIYANGAAAGLNVANQQGHGIILWGGAQVVRSVNGAISMTGYANRAAGGVNNWANISGGVTLYDGGVTIRAKGNLTLNGVSSSGIGLYLTYTAGTGGGITSDEGNILMNGLSNAASYGGALIRLPITATLGSVTFSGSGQNYGYYQDAWYGSVWAKTDVNLIGYATNGHGIYLGIGSVTSGDGNVILSGYTSSATTTDYGIYSNGINASASNGSVTFQGSQLDNVTTLANAISSRVTNTRPDPYFAIADAAVMAGGQTRGLSWTGSITANTSSGQINVYSKAPNITGVMTAYGLLLVTSNQSYTLTRANTIISVLAGNIGTGSLNYTTNANLEIGSLSGVDGFTGTDLSLNQTATLTQTKPISVATLNLSGGGSSAFVLDQANSVTTSAALNHGTIRLGNNAALGSTSRPLTMAASTILQADTDGLTISNPVSMTGAATINAPTGRTLAFSGILSGASGVLTVNNPSTNTGTVLLSGANGYAGATTVGAGTLAISNATGLGTTAGGTTVASGATLDLRNVAVGAEAITVNGGTIAASTGTSSLSGTVALGAASAVNVGGTQLTLTGIVSGAQALQKLGIGHLILTATNTYSGVTTIGAGNLTFRNDVPNLASSSFVGPGNLLVEPAGANFTSAYTFNEVLSSATKLGGLTIGKAGSTQNITTSTATDVAGPITLIGGTIAINAALTASNAALNVTAGTALTQTAAIVAKDVILQGAGAFTLTNTSNNVESISGGDVTRIGNLSLTDASGGLTLNAVVSAGTIRVETVVGDITLAQNLATTSTSTDAISVNAGRSAAVGTTTGGNILVSGTPTITMGTGGIAKLYSGSEAASTGLTALVGGSSKTRFTADEGTTTFSPVLAGGNSYAIYRSTVPASPTNLVATAGNAQISVAFTAGADGGGSITNYEYTLDGGTNWIAANPSVTSSPLVITGLTNYTTYPVQIRAVNNAGGGTSSSSVSAMPVAPNASPTDINTSASTVAENVAANTTIGTLSSTDINVGDTFTYTLVAGSGDTDNSAFNISGSSLRITASPDFETKSSYSLRLRSTDQSSLSFEKALTITITNVNEAPTDIALTANSVAENVVANTIDNDRCRCEQYLYIQLVSRIYR
jgi:autotransporter-associated beta strand protein